MANREQMTIAMIGCGRFAKFFVSHFKAHPVGKKVYVCDLKPERAEQYSKDFDVEIIGSFEEALASKEINAVAIFTQRFKHGPMVIEALKAGKHVYSAVPCSLKPEEIAEIARLVKETRLTYSMGETGFYRAPAIFCRQEFEKGTFGKFTYGEAQYNHDIRNMQDSFASSGGEDWRRFAGIPPFFYPTHSTSMVLSAMPGERAVKVTAFGFAATVNGSSSNSTRSASLPTVNEPTRSAIPTISNRTSSSTLRVKISSKISFIFSCVSVNPLIVVSRSIVALVSSPTIAEIRNPPLRLKLFL